VGKLPVFPNNINLLTTFGTSATYRTLTVRYILVEADASYNILFGHWTLNQFHDMAMKFSTENVSIITVKVNPKITQECYVNTGSPILGERLNLK